MSKTVLVLFVGCVGLSLLSLHLVKQMRAGDAQIAELTSQIAALQRERQATPPPPQIVEPAQPATIQPEPVPTPAKDAPKPAATFSAAPTSMPPIGAGVPSREDRMRMMREHRERQRQLMQDPEYRAAMRVQHRSNMGRMYPGLAEDLGLDAGQTEQLFDLLADQQMRANEQSEALWADVDNSDPAAMQQRHEKLQRQMAEQQRKNEAEIASRFGQDKLQAWKEYQSTLGARHQAEALRTTLASQGTPLSEDASRSMVKALAEAQKLEMQEYANAANQSRVAGISVKTGASIGFNSAVNSEMFERQLEATKKRQQRMLDAISPYLSYEQRQAIEKEHEAQIKLQEAQIRVMRAQSQGNSGQGNVIHQGFSSGAGMGVPLQPAVAVPDP